MKCRFKDSRQFLSGDILMFAGTSWKSRVIAATTGYWSDLARGEWYSHCGFIAPYNGRPMLFESTTRGDLPCEIAGKRIHGVQAHDPLRRIESYEGRVWLLRLVDREINLTPEREGRLAAFALKHLGAPYDYDGAPLAATHVLKWLHYFKEDLDTLFCSAYLMAAFKAADLVDKDINAATYTPAGARSDLLYWGTVKDEGGLWVNDIPSSGGTFKTVSVRQR